MFSLVRVLSVFTSWLIILRDRLRYWVQFKAGEGRYNEIVFVSMGELANKLLFNGVIKYVYK